MTNNQKEIAKAIKTYGPRHCADLAELTGISRDVVELEVQSECFDRWTGPGGSMYVSEVGHNRWS